jgi:hypothetical protein
MEIYKEGAIGFHASSDFFHVQLRVIRFLDRGLVRLSLEDVTEGSTVSAVETISESTMAILATESVREPATSWILCVEEVIREEEDSTSPASGRGPLADSD